MLFNFYQPTDPIDWRWVLQGVLSYGVLTQGTGSVTLTAGTVELIIEGENLSGSGRNVSGGAISGLTLQYRGETIFIASQFTTLTATELQSLLAGAGGAVWNSEAFLSFVAPLMTEEAVNTTGSPNPETLCGSSLSDTIDGQAGDDVIRGGAGVDNLSGDAGSDLLDYSFEPRSVGVAVDLALNTSYENGPGAVPADNIQGFERVIATSLADALIGSDSDNMLFGMAGNDRLSPGALGVDRLDGGLGDDTYELGGRTLGALQVTIVDQGGTDTVTAAVSTSLVSLPGIERLTLLGPASKSLIGTGNGLANVITGHAGPDTLNGGLGNDTLTGGLGADRFSFTTLPNAISNKDVITDFDVISDTIVLENAVFTKLLQATSSTGVTLLSTSFWKSLTGLAHDGDDRIIYETDTGLLRYDSDGTGVAASVVFAGLKAGLAITNADFVVT